MVDRENREDWRRERSLLALGQAVRGEDEADASLVSIGDRADPSWREDAATRHRLARSQREARSNPSLDAAPETAQLRPAVDPFRPLRPGLKQTRPFAASYAQARRGKSRLPRAIPKPTAPHAALRAPIRR